ncbi:hypothetical protein BDZ85DRAFT_265379 [Elsinoe ampelina]|uniref:Uncharacterized protein n=1 Tax=Elsinoe ampelina TaxID=302913 RepID=A0A6A6G785_9PEZI|nr:hypothetical protein BDZ85DRAFT_265379 [Elsinoe ampelina]
MVERRLQVLDQNPEIDYFRVGLDFKSVRSKPADLRPPARLSDRLSSTTSTGSSISTRSGHSETSTSSSSTIPARATTKTGRRKAGNILGLVSETSLGKAGRPMSIIDERPGSVISNDGVTALPSKSKWINGRQEGPSQPEKERDRAIDQQRVTSPLATAHGLNEKENGAPQTVCHEEKAERKVTGLRKLAERGHRRTGSGRSLLLKNTTGSRSSEQAGAIGSAI